MNQSLRVQDSRSRELQNNESALADLHKHLNTSTLRSLLRLIQIDSPLALEFAQAFQTDEFATGDCVASVTAPTVANPSALPEATNHDFYVVSQGRIRLLGWDSTRQREVSIAVLEVGETFGGDHLFCDTPVAYRAIAAGSSQIARLPLAQLQPWLTQLTAFRRYLQQQAQQRERLIFLKTCTALGSHAAAKRAIITSDQIQQLLPYLTVVHLPAGTVLEQTDECRTGCFWLRQGEISSLDGQFKPPAVGDCWGYAAPTQAAWIAQTDLVIYRLPEAYWDAAAAIAPALFTTPDQLHPTAAMPSAATAAPLNGASGNGCNPTFAALDPPTGYPLNRAAPGDGQATLSGHADATALQPAVDFPQPPRSSRSSRRFWQRYPFIQQQSSSDCGVACLAMVGKYWGKRFSLNTLRDRANVGRIGASLKNLATAAESVGFQVRPVRASFSRLVEQTPWIAHWEGDHYVVVYEISRDRVLVADPALGHRHLSRQEFQAHWTGYALLLEPTPQLAAAETEKLSLKRWWGLLIPYRTLILQIVSVSLLLQVFGLVTPLFTQIILDRVVVHKSLPALHVFAIGLILFGVWRVGMVTVRQYLLDYFSNRLDLVLVSGFINHTLRLPLKFFESRQVGDIITRVQENQKIQMFLTRQVVLAWLDMLMGLVYLGLMLYYNWQLTVLVLAVILPIVILTAVASPFLRAVSRRIFNADAKQNSTLVEMMTGFATIKAAAAEQDLRWRWEENLTSLLNERFRGQKLANGLQAMGGLINTLGSTALLWFGATLVIQDQLSIGQYVAFNMLVGSVIGPLLSVVGLWDELQEVFISVERLNDVFETQPEETAANPPANAAVYTW